MENLHVPRLVGHHEGGGEAVFVVQGAAPHRVAHARHRGVPCNDRKRGRRGCKLQRGHNEEEMER